MNFSVTNNRLKLSNGYDVSGSINTSSLLVGTSAGINPTSTLDVSGTANITGNLSVDTNTLFVDASNNRVGIGNNNPLSKLVVGNSIGTGYGATIDSSGTSFGMVVRNYSISPSTDNNASLWLRNINTTTSADTTLFRVNNNGNVGIGTIAPALSLDVSGSGRISGPVGIGMTPISATLDVSGSGRISGNFRVDTNTLFVDASNNRVGFATTTPSTLLDCYGEGSFGFQNYSIQSTQRVLSLRGEGINEYYNPSRYNFYTKPGSNTPIDGLSTLSIRSQYGADPESGDLFTLAGNGNVGINKNNPAYPLDVSGRANISGDFSVDTNTLFVDASNNRVGIGTTAPTTLYDCYGEGSFGFQDYRTQATQRVLSLRGEGISSFYAQSRYNFYTKPGTPVDGSSTLSIRSQYSTNPESGDLFTLAGNGNVGIGTSTPTNTLDISGNTLRLRTARTPASATATGNAGEICWDANYVYVCVATNTWKRSALSTWP